MLSPEQSRKELLATTVQDKEQLTAEQEAALADPELQKRYQEEALIQLRRLQCPGCGESDLF